MGSFISFQSREEYFEERKKEISIPKPIFPGHFELEQKILNNQKDMLTASTKIGDFSKWLISKVDTGGISTVFTKCIDFMLSQYDVEKALLDLKIKKEIVQSAACFIRAEVEAVSRQLNFLANSTSLSEAERLNHLILADDSCFKILRKFMDDKFYLKEYPFASAPLLANFIAIYVPIAIANYNVTSSSTKRRELFANIQDLKTILQFYQDKAIAARMSHITTVHDEGAGSLIDQFLKEKRTIHMDFYTFRKPEILSYVTEYYKTKVKEVYMAYFNPAWRCIDECLGFLDYPSQPYS